MTEAIRSKKSVTGKRWQFNGKLTIRKRGRDYMKRRYLLSTPWFGIYLHHILLPDQDRGPHDHPWNMRTFILKGWYVEEVFTFGVPLGEHNQIVASENRLKVLAKPRQHRRFSLMKLTTDQLHRITQLSRGGAWTLCLVGRRQREWGFLVPDEGWVVWHEETNRGEEVYG